MKKSLVFALFSLVSLFAFLFLEGVFAFSGGQGSLEEPYLVSDCQQLQDILTSPYSYYSLTDNIDCSMARSWNNGRGFQPLDFKGIFEGNGKNITNLFINRTGLGPASLFGYATANIYDLGVTNATIIGVGYVGGFASQQYGGVIYNSFFQGNIYGADHTGGLVGEQNRGSVINSFFSGNIIGDREVGGLVGAQVNSTLLNSYSFSNIVGRKMFVGGLVGFQVSGLISNSYWVGTYDAPDWKGGLVGAQYAPIDNCFIIDSFFNEETSKWTWSCAVYPEGSCRLNNSRSLTTSEIQWGMARSWDNNSWNAEPYLQDFYPYFIYHYPFLRTLGNLSSWRAPAPSFGTNRSFPLQKSVYEYDVVSGLCGVDGLRWFRKSLLFPNSVLNVSDIGRIDCISLTRFSPAFTLPSFITNPRAVSNDICSKSYRYDYCFELAEGADIMLFGVNKKKMDPNSSCSSQGGQLLFANLFDFCAGEYILSSDDGPSTSCCLGFSEGFSLCSEKSYNNLPPLLCGALEICDGLQTPSFEGTCCFGQCQKQSCSAVQGFVCQSNQFCPGSKLNTIEDTCCDVPCREINCNSCSECGNGLLNTCDRNECMDSCSLTEPQGCSFSSSFLSGKCVSRKSFNLTSCGILNQSGVYTLQNDLFLNLNMSELTFGGSCLYLLANDIELNLNGHGLFGIVNLSEQTILFNSCNPVCLNYTLFPGIYPLIDLQQIYSSLNKPFGGIAGIEVIAENAVIKNGKIALFNTVDVFTDNRIVEGAGFTLLNTSLEKFIITDGASFDLKSVSWDLNGSGDAEGIVAYGVSDIRLDNLRFINLTNSPVLFYFEHTNLSLTPSLFSPTNQEISFYFENASESTALNLVDSIYEPTYSIRLLNPYLDYHGTSGFFNNLIQFNGLSGSVDTYNYSGLNVPAEVYNKNINFSSSSRVKIIYKYTAPNGDTFTVPNSVVFLEQPVFYPYFKAKVSGFEFCQGNEHCSNGRICNNYKCISS